VFKTILKFGFAGAILIWLIKKGDLDLSLISQAITLHPLSVTLCIFLVLFSAVGTSFRWKLLLEVKSQGKLPRKKIIGLTWIGLLFSSVLPGAVTGDVLKVVYAKDLDATLTKTFLITSALMDRIIGLLGLLFLLGFFSIWHYSELIALSIDMKKLLQFNFFLLMGAIGFFITLFLPQKIQIKILEILKKIPLFGNSFFKVLSGVWAMGSEKVTILKCLGMSIIFQAGNVLAIYVISYPFFTADINLSTFFTFIPLGLMCTALPISPAGLGIGHAAFGTLFSYYGISKGASLFNLYFLCLVFVNLMGIFPFFLMGKRSRVMA
jgi:hypothetical protein